MTYNVFGGMLNLAQSSAVMSSCITVAMCVQSGWLPSIQSRPRRQTNATTDSHRRLWALHAREILGKDLGQR